ncbi:hypothetical protein TNCV_1573631 [Trichonephila clavipes]|nr:hypothetical protein TNCV_1573631 [Trichonephila clavipes]
MPPDSRVVPRRKKGDEHPPPSVCGRMSLSSFSLHHDVTGQQGSVSTKKRIRKPTVAASAVGCRCHSSAGNNTRTDSRVVPRRKKFDEHPTSRVLGRMSLSAFRVQQDATGHRSIASTEKVTDTDRGVATVGCRCHRSACTKMRPDSRVVPRRKKGDEHPTPSVCGRMSLSSSRVHQDATGQQSSA